MLLGIDARMTPDLLSCLARMGHGDEIALVDSNYPAASTAAHCVIREPIQLTGLDAAEAARLITSVMPLDPFVPHCALRMEVDGQPDEVTDVHRAVFDIIEERMPEGAGTASIERQDYYAHARTCFAVVQCSEARAFGCFILRKGVVF
ncbi:ribose ABC transporter [Alphaproteobacteria bacterium GH1-50]|uniref:Ribose ABC transporter n=1 Tax=Kangsaoukella pontilimi TaxID=2691042 RepID=A0A7C9MHT8_9RHOB|nr:RbsD/FucU domain-containing protein [Kangsaoukella pontilimi]MXQ09216.1 ribose ABC transporter [Kangsaoukella pontilimi]